MYSPILTAPMREDLTRLGVIELKTPQEVDKALKNMKGSAMVIVNSVCGCAAGGARPGVRLALQNKKLPDKIYTVFAGMDKEATERARTYFTGFTPSSPSIAIMKDGKIVKMIERKDIEGRSPTDIAKVLVESFERL